jgi:ubiquinone/menaquinone biosynthesis C-methylase UbiE
MIRFRSERDPRAALHFFRESSAARGVKSEGTGLRMKRLIASILFAVDRRLPAPRVGGRESPEAYANWEYRTGKAILDEYAARFGTLEGRTVLDVGCGLGGKSMAYAEAGARVVGVDIEAANVQHSASFARSCAGVRFIAGDAERLPFADRSFDLIVANDSLEHFRDPAAALDELERVLKPDGRLFLFFTPWGSPLGSHLYDYIHTPWCHLLYPEWLIRELLERAAMARGAPDPAAESERLMGEYHIELNKITVARYRRILRAHPDLELEHEELKPPKFRFLAPLAHVPRLGELFTGTVVAVLRKRRGGSPAPAGNAP